ncbi:MAG: phosphotransferase family protein [Clostridiales bacterium]|jgi:thiamine kinase-like enzyme|nr:phosphotransferase family protein [Clostridiales bacterium]
MLKIIAKIFGCEIEDIKDIEPLKKGMTNTSFIFGICGGEGRYIIRIPGKGTDRLINRRQEYNVYAQIMPLGFCDDIVYICPDTGYKTTKFWEGARVCNAASDADRAKCMKLLRDFHKRALTVKHEFCPFERIEFYEDLWQGKPSRYADYAATKANIISLKPYIDNSPKERVLSHIDAVHDNFIFLPNGELRLIDWEYSAMQDPHIDIAMFIVYAMHSRAQADKLIDHYFTEGCPPYTRRKIYAYIAICGLLWSNWCEFKMHLSEDFGEYAAAQYNFAREFFVIFKEANDA